MQNLKIGRSDRHLFPLGCIAVLVFPCILSADEVKFRDGGRLTGDVLAIQEGGLIQLDSPLATEPLKLNGDAVLRVTFSDADEQPLSPGDTRVVLTNGDFLTASLIGYSRERGVVIDAGEMGELEIPPHHLHSLRLGVHSAKTIYQGPDDLANWDTDDRRASQNWRLEGERLTVNGSGQVGRMLDLPDHYVIRFNLSWQGQPNFQLGFSDPLENQQTRVDRYYLQFGRAGLEIKRESSTGRRYHTVGTLNRRPDQFPNRNMDIELRVDRNESVIHLAINGQPEGRFMDPFENPPTAGGISLVSNASNGNHHEIRDLTVANWHEQTPEPSDIHDRGPDATRDAMVIRYGDHYSGVLESIRRQGGELLFTMKVDFREDPMEILGEDVATVHFARQDDEYAGRADDAATDFVLEMGERGRLAVIRSSFDDGHVTAEHPLIGNFTISRNHVSAVQRKPEAALSNTK